MFLLGKRMFRLLGPWEQESRYEYNKVRRDIRGKVVATVWETDMGRFGATCKKNFLGDFMGAEESVQASVDKKLVEDGWELVD